jgi:flagellar protein FliJ
MKPFKLQSVLDYRQLLENRAQEKHAEILKREAGLIADIHKEQEELKLLYADLEERQQTGITSHELLLYEKRISHKTEKLTGHREGLEEVREELVASRQALCEASREKKLLEKLKENQEQEHRRELRRREAAVLDEISVQFHKR